MMPVSLALAAAALTGLVTAAGTVPAAAQQDQGDQGPMQGLTFSYGKNAKAGEDGSSQGNAQNGSSPKAQTAQVGAGTVDGVTTGTSGPKQKSSSGPTSPQASLCNSYDGAVKTDCLQTVLRNGGKGTSGVNGGAQQQNGGVQGGNGQNGNSGGHSNSGPSNHGG